MHLQGEVGTFTTCAMYEKRYENMLIVMVDADGKAADLSYCEPSAWPVACKGCSPED